MPIYLKFDSINGDVTQKGHEKWIEVLSLSWGVTQAVASGPAGGGGGAGKATFQDLHFVQQTQSSSPKILQAVATGQHQKSVLVSFVKASTKGGEYLKIKLEDVLVSSFQIGASEGSGGDVSSDQVALHFAKISFTWEGVKPDGTPAQNVEFDWDVAHNRLP